MALATRCPHCQTAFRVASDQLKLRAGLVRCGTCKQIFNGIENLLRPDEDIPAALAASAPPLPPVPVLISQDDPVLAPRVERGDNTRFNDLIAEVDQPEALQAIALQHEPGEPVSGAVDQPQVPLAQAVSHDASSDALWAALDDEPVAHDATNPGTVSDPEIPAASPGPTGRSGDAFLPEPATTGSATPAVSPDDTMQDKPQDDMEEVQARDIGDAAPDSAPEPLPENASPLPGLLRAARIDPDEDLTLPVRAPLPKAAPALPEPAPDIPDFIAREQQEQGTRRVLRPALWCGGALLVLLLAGQVIYAARSPIAATLPQTRTTLDAACRMIGCLVALPMQIDSVSIESSDFQPVPEKRDQFTLSVVLRNRSSTVEAWPAIELSLNDASEKTVARRVILPREYLPAGLTTARGFAAGSEQALKVNLDLARLPASGYRVYLFYP